jgi:hypothetical protein
MPNVIDFPDVTDEGEGSRITAAFYDQSGAQLDGQSIVELELTLRNEADGAVINTRLDSNILNQNGGSVAEDGTLTLKLTGEDNAIITRDGYEEPHIATIQWSWVDLQSAQQWGQQKWRIRVAPKKLDESLQRGWVG